jgi:hypothetical protein
MFVPPKGYVTIGRAVEATQVAAERRLASEGPDPDRSVGDAGALVHEALKCGELLAAAVRKADGELVSVLPAAWRRLFARPDDPTRVIGYNDYWKRERTAPAIPARVPFDEARQGNDIPVLSQRGGYAAWGTPLLAHSDLAVWLDETEIPLPPVERPADWPRRQSDVLKAVTDQQLEWFLIGYAVRALESGKPATRDEARDAVTRENIATARDVERLHAQLPTKLKNPNRAKGLRNDR